MSSRHSGRTYRAVMGVGGCLLISLLLSACASDDASDGVAGRTTASPSISSPSSSSPSISSPSISSVESASSGSGEAATATASSAGTTPATATSGPAELVLVGVGDGLDRPIDLAVRPGDAALYVVEQGGTVVQIGIDDKADRREVLDVTDLTKAKGEQGLLGLAFSPDGKWGYIDYTDRAGDTVIAAIPVADDGTFDSSQIRDVLQIDQPYSNHNGGDLEFGPDGMLYIATGDGGSGGDPQRHASDPASLLGKLLRVDPTPTAPEPYRVPDDNPFAGGADRQGDGAPEVWSWGLRNPWRFAFDTDGSLWIADVGQNEYEEVDHVSPTGGEPAGRAANFGWSAMEGDQPFNADVSSKDVIAPVWVYPHGPGCSISGGVAYRGQELTGVTGDYFYGDFCSGDLWAYRASDGTNRTVLTDLGSISTVRTGPDGEIYVLTIDGQVRRLAETTR